MKLKRTFCLIIVFNFYFTLTLFAQDELQLLATMTGEKTGDMFSVVSGVGDVNGDGYDDVLVGTRYGNYAKLYFGGAPFDTIADLRFTGVNIGAAGDVNGDGYDDILVLNAHKVYLYFGGSDMDTIADFEFEGEYYQEMFGTTLTGVGDVNGDGFDDFMISSSYNWYDGMGRMYLFFEGTSLDNVPSITFVSDKMEDFFGYSGCGGIDINCDGFDDIIISSPAQLIAADSGKVMIYFGGAEMDSIADIILPGTDIDFGKIIANAGDLNGDEISDFLISSLQYVHLYLGIDSLIVIPASNMGFGGFISVGAGGDINNDGFDDFLIGNTNYRNSADVMVGQIRGYYGAAALDTLCDFCMEGETKWGEFSKYITIVGDINGDGFDEVLIGAPKFSDYQNPQGKVYVYSYTEGNVIDELRNRIKPQRFQLFQNYPNPFNIKTRIDFIIDRPSNVNLVIYNPIGQKVQTLIDNELDKGWYSYIWDAKEMANGIYLCSLTTLKCTNTIKLLLIK